MINYATILIFNYPNTQWAINNDSDYDTLEWHESSPKPTKDELDALWQTTLDKINANAYIAKRASEYPPITDFADAYYWAQKGNTALMDAYVAKCEATKQKYPKGVA
jgi:hypothetical protein